MEVDYKIYPTLLNSFENRLRIEVPSQKEQLNLIIFDVNGKVIQEKQITDAQSEIFVQDINPGIYFASLFKNNLQVYQTKIIVTN